ncbi:UNVERIFIED_CONTAM: hypothetical protein Slati_2681800 [Sesamum latifolium]|uniref:Uncharacterized protein n=1 Tax=Sesamum latifolium TaxID=2727402 RepID=A0AAW2VX23_9LAMI
MIQGFNQGRQRAVGIIRMQLTMEDMVPTALFHVIDAKTSYNMLLGHPWLYENVVVPSTWHQCFKYCHNGIIKKVLGDIKSFTEAESHFADAKYYIEVLRKKKRFCPPKSRSHVISLKQTSKLPLEGFVCSTQEEEGGHEALAIDEKEFDPKAVKLFVKAGYNAKEKLSLGKLPPEATGKKLHGLNATQIMLKEKGHAIQDSRGKCSTSASLIQEEEGAYITLLHEFKDVFAWSYKEMPGLDPKVVVHHLSVKKGDRPVKQGQRRFRPELIPLIETEVNKLIEVGFI